MAGELENRKSGQRDDLPPGRSCSRLGRSCDLPSGNSYGAYLRLAHRVSVAAAWRATGRGRAKQLK